MNTEVEKEEDRCDYFEFTQEDIRNTDIVKWYEKFQAVTIPTIMLPIPLAMLEYLRDTFVYHHDEWTTTKWTTESSDDSWGSDSNDHVSDADIDSSDVENQQNPPANIEHIKIPKEILLEYDQMILKILEDFEGSVMPKVNWKAPKDASWAALNKSLRCYSPGEIFYLFKTSNDIHDLVSDPFKMCTLKDDTALDFKIVLRQWLKNISPDLEFRAFVCNQRLTAICQRETEVGYSTICNLRNDIIKDIHDFFCDKIYGRFPSDFYVFDVVRLKERRVLLIDFGVFGLPTDPLLYTYRELKMIKDEVESNASYSVPDEDRKSGLRNVAKYGEPYFRYISESYAIRPTSNFTRAAEDITTYLRESSLH